MAERLSHEIAQLLAEPDGGGRQQTRVDALVHARLSADIAEGLDESPRPGAAGTGERARLAALIDRGLPPAERDAMLAALTQDPVGRAELSSAAELVDAVNNRSYTVPPRLLARAVEAFGGEPIRVRPVTAPWPLARPRRLSSRWMLSLAAVLLVAVITPAVLLVIGDRSDQGGEPIDRSISASGIETKAAPEQRPATPATSCDNRGAPAQPSATGKPAPTKSAPAPTDDPCRPKPTAQSSRATPPPPGEPH
jgi:hypothetical protein